jgi:hypothetical protein
MKTLKLLFALPVIVMFSLISGSPFTSCSKSVTDTVYVKHDSIIIVYDTTTVHDTTYDITSGMVAYYNFNGGNLNDSSGYNNNINFNNATPTADRFGRANNAYLFNGSSSYMTVPNSPSLNPNSITLYAIIKVNGFYYGGAHGNFILVKDYDQADGMYMLQFADYMANYNLPDTSQEYFEGTYGDNNNTSSAAPVAYQSSPVTKGTWYKLTYTYDGITAKLYLNGILVNSLIRTVPFTENSLDLYIGASGDPSGLFPFWFNGVIDEIRIYNRALPPQAVTQLNNLTD